MESAWTRVKIRLLSYRQKVRIPRFHPPDTAIGKSAPSSRIKASDCNWMHNAIQLPSSLNERRQI